MTMTTILERGTIAKTSPIGLGPDSVSRATRGLPFAVRQAFAFAARLEAGTLTARMPDGRIFRFGGKLPGPDAEIFVKNYAFARRLIGSGDIGIAEAYLRGEWETPDLTAFLEVFCANHALIAQMLENRPVVRWIQQVRHWLNRNTKSGSRRNIHAHYDLGNAFYEAWLDPTMTYSSALFAEGDNDLSSAQTRKYRELARATGIEPGHHVLEIGCGWGGFAEFAAREIGCRVTGLTISQEQFDYARRRIFEQGLAEKVDIQLRDYRDETGTFDRIASIEMFEAVGEEYWPVYFQQLRDRLAAGGRAGLQIITIQDRFFETYRREIDFIRRYIFPGGMLPSPSGLRQLGEKVGLTVAGERIFGRDYGITVAAWREKFVDAWPHLAPLGFDERFKRMWTYYLSYCEAGFRAGNIDVRQVVFAKST
jgi:cyclopropane-fatty-acyl-phospholipid synthase